MSKRKNRKSSGAPNLPKETLYRARQEAGLMPIPAEAEEETSDEAVEAVIVAPAPEVKRSRETLPTAQVSSTPPKRKSRRKQQLTYDEMTPEEVAEALANPTIEVSEGALREQYNYVLADLRSMGLLAAALFVALIVIAGVIIV